MYISKAEDIILYLCFSVFTMGLLLWKFDVSLAERNRLDYFYSFNSIYSRGKNESRWLYEDNY